MSVLGEAVSAFGLWITRQERKEERDDEAVRTVLTALMATKRYLAGRSRGEGVDRQSESDLVDLWAAAAVSIRRTEPELAVRLQRKADYWTNPENWTEDAAADDEIRIDKIAAEAERLLAQI